MGWRGAVVAKIPNSFFKVWTPEMAYVLGYWWADGGMLQTAASKRVGFTSKDGEYLEQIARTIGVGRVAHITVSGQTYYQLMIKRSDLFDDLLQLGGTPGKSLTATWHAPRPGFLRHFVRGFVDGDGSLYWLRTAITTHPRIQVAGTKEFLSGMASAIEQETGIPVPTNFVNENIWRTTWSGMYAKCLTSWLYENCNLCLERKRKIALEFFQWQPKLYRRSHITPKMHELFGHLLPERSPGQSVEL
jgi:hypothetical protein